MLEYTGGLLTAMGIDFSFFLLLFSSLSILCLHLFDTYLYFSAGANYFLLFDLFFHVLPARETPSHTSYPSMGSFSLPDSELVRHILPHCGMFHLAPDICATSYIIHRHSNGPRDRCEARIWEAVDEWQNGKGESKNRGRN